MTATNNNEKYFIDPAEETQKAVTAYKLASSDEDADFSASLAKLALTATSLTLQLNELGKRNLKKAEELIDRVPDDPTVKVMIRLIWHDPSQIVMF